MVHFWLRHETKPNERRTALLPEHVAKLLAAGHSVTVEYSPVRCAPDEEYKQVMCSYLFNSPLIDVGRRSARRCRGVTLGRPRIRLSFECVQ